MRTAFFLALVLVLGCSTTTTTPRTPLRSLLFAPESAIDSTAAQIKAEWAEAGFPTENYNLGIDHLAAMRALQLLRGKIAALGLDGYNANLAARGIAPATAQDFLDDLQWLDWATNEHWQTARSHLTLADREAAAQRARAERSTQRTYDALAIFGAAIGGAVLGEALTAPSRQTFQHDQIREQLFQERLLFEQRQQTEALRRLQPPYRPSACRFGAPNC